MKLNCIALLFLVWTLFGSASLADRPNIILVMTDDQGWGQTGYNGHPLLKTPNLDAMADGGLRFNRFYAAAPVCSPTRASVLTGRTNMRTGVESHGFALRHQEKTLVTALRDAGYATGHFGKWHLNGMRGPGVPIFADDSHNPGAFGFEEWFSVTNFFDRDPVISRNGDFEEFAGDSSEVIVDEALRFIEKQSKASKPFLSVIWYGTPHSPFRASEEDAKPFSHLDKNSQLQHGELVAMDRSVGTLRKRLRELKIAENTLVWFCSDNGGLPRIKPDTVGGLRGNKSTMYEGGLRVPGIIEWPAKIKPRVTEFPAVVMDIFPTLAAIVDLPTDTMLQPQDGVSLLSVLNGKDRKREQRIPFQCFGNTVLLDNNYKLLHVGPKKGEKNYELYNLSTDSKEEHNLYESNPKVAKRMTESLVALKQSIANSYAGQDYLEGKLLPGDPAPRSWADVDQYRPFFNEWKTRPEYKSWLK